MASTASEVKFREERSTAKLSSYGSTGGAGLEIGMRGTRTTSYTHTGSGRWRVQFARQEGNMAPVLVLSQADLALAEE